jgi:proline dehydrogenase
MEQYLLKIASEALKKAALNEDAKNFVLQNDKLFKVLKSSKSPYWRREYRRGYFNY